jgi:hypothetical protein
MPELPRDFLGNRAHIVPLSDPANGYTRSGNAQTTTANPGTPGDQAANFGDGCLRVTPAMAAGIADQVWEVRDLLN